jgi:hypothetical protein
MTTRDIPDLEHRALELHSKEIWRLEDAAAHQMAMYTRLAGAGMLHGLYLFSEMIRPLFSWVPNEPRRP